MKIDESLGFKLISLTVQEHPILGDNTFTFFEEFDNVDSIYMSIIIGANGTGKSEILKFIIKLFRDLYRIRIGGKFTHISQFELVFANNGDIYTYTNFYSDSRKIRVQSNSGIEIVPPYLTKNGINCESEEPLEFLPKSIVANSIMLTDKFYVPRNENEINDFPIYKYLGVRYSPQQASTRYYIRKTVDFIVSQFGNSFFIEGLRELTSFLGLESTVRILYKSTSTKVFFHRDVTPDNLTGYFNEIDVKYLENKKIPPFKLNYFKKHYKENREKLEQLCEFIRTLVDSGNFEGVYRSSAKIISFNILEPDSYERFQYEYSQLEELRQLGFLHAPEIIIQKNIHLSQTSSGEYHFFSTMIGLMASMQENSLVLIDEPEISLHPNWQMQYLSFIRKLFSNEMFKTCQLIIATHSHFLISDLKGNSAAIIALSKKNNVIEQIDLGSGLNTFCWSAEDVLYNVFNVYSTRNYYVAKEIGGILKELSKKDFDKSKGEKYISSLLEIKENLKQDDPLKKLIENIEKEVINA